MSVDTNALTSLANAKAYLNVKDQGDDTLLESLINRVSDRIERITSRRFNARDWRFWLTSDRNGTVLVPQFPLIYVNRVATGSEIALSVTYSGTEIRATAQVYYDDEGTAAASGVRLVSYSTTGARSTTEILFSTSGSTNALKDSIDAVSGWSATLGVNVPGLDLHPVGGQNAKSRTVQLTHARDNDDEYRVDHTSGVVELTRWNTFDRGFSGRNVFRAFQGILVEARAGYKTIPDDVEAVALEILSGMYRFRTVNPAIASESIGDYSYSNLDQSAVDESVRNKLRAYMRSPVYSGQ